MSLNLSKFYWKNIFDVLVSSFERVRLKVIKNEMLITMGGWPVSSDKWKAFLEKEAQKRDAYKINPKTGIMAEYLAFIIN